MRGVSSIELHASNKSQIASQALSYISALYEVEREVKPLSIDERLHIRQARSKPLTDALYQWMVLQRRQITNGTATAKAIDSTASSAGVPSRALWMTDNCRSTTTGQKTRSGVCTWRQSVVRPGWRPVARKRRGRLLAFSCKPGRSLCRYVPFLLHLAQLAGVAQFTLDARRR